MVKRKSGKKIIKIILWLFLSLLSFHYFWFTKYEDYYNYDFINTSANHAAVRCWHKKEKSLLEISEEVFAQIRKKTGLSESTAHKEKRRNESRELDQLQEKIARLRRSKKSAQIELKEYEKKLKIFKEGIITDIRKLLTSSQLTITELDAREWWKILRQDPANFFLLRPFNWFTRKIRRYLWAEMIFKIAVIELILTSVIYALLKNLPKELPSPFETLPANKPEKEPNPKKILFLLAQTTSGSVIILFLARVLVNHPCAFDRLHPLFLSPVNFWWCLLLIFFPASFRFFLKLGWKIVRHWRVPRRRTLRKYLLKHWGSETLITLLFFLLFSGWKNSRGSSLFILASVFCGFLIKTLLPQSEVLTKS